MDLGEPLPRGATIAFLSCSQPLREKDLAQVDALEGLMQAWGLRVFRSPYLAHRDQEHHYPAPLRARVLMECFQRSEIAAIFDLSGGDAANEVLGLLDWPTVRANPKPFFGYSDNTVLLNALQTRAGVPAWHFQALNLIGPFSESLGELFQNFFLEGSSEAPVPEGRFLRGTFLEGPVAGGNVRCLMKLAGTPYWPEWKGRILFLESWGAEGALLSSLLHQLEQTRVLDEIRGILLGTFSVWEKKEGFPTMESLTLDISESRNLPVVKVRHLGHGKDAWPLPLGVPLVWRA